MDKGRCGDISAHCWCCLEIGPDLNTFIHDLNEEMEVQWSDLHITQSQEDIKWAEWQNQDPKLL